MSEKRKRPFTPYEKELLREITIPYLHIVESKKTDAVYNKSKTDAWLEIATKFNESPQSQEATHVQLKKLWLNMKTRARDVKTAARQRMHTGGGPFINDPDPEDDLLGDISINILPTIKTIKDSDGPGDNDGDDDEASYAKKPRMSTTPSPATPERNRELLKQTEQTQNVTSPQNTKTLRPKSQNKQNSTSIPTIDSLKIQLIEKDITQREQMFQEELEQTVKANQIRLEIMKLELDHKKRFYAMLEEEQAIRIERAKNE